MFRAIRRSLRNKVLLLVLAITVSALALSAAGLIVYDLQSYERQASEDLYTQAQVLARAAAPALAFNDQRTGERDLSMMRARPDVLAAALYTKEGGIFARYVRPGAQLPPFPASPQPAGYRISGDHIAVYRPVVEGEDTIGTVFLLGSYEPWERLRDYLSIILAVMVVALLVAIMLSAWLQGAVTDPILEVARMSGEVVRNRDYSLRATKLSEDEIGQLGEAFNSMLAEIGRRSAELHEADKRKDEFLATLAHELRNPLAPIRTALEILRVAGNDPQKSKSAREIMQRQVTQMVRLVDDLLDVSRITTGKLAIRHEPMDLRDAVRDAVETATPFIQSRQHALEVSLPAEPLIAMGDRTRLAQVFGNLLNNAAKYTHPGGHISISLARDGGEAEVRVLDDGIGLSPEAIERIFDMFVQVDKSLERAQAGLGVGLTLARQLVQLHEGTVTARSGVGDRKGSEFIVRLPLAEITVPDRAAGRAESPAAPAKRILLADDNEDFVETMRLMLASLGHDVRVANDGEEALATAADFRPDIAFVDIGMPKVHGYEVARRLRSQPSTASCVLVAVTGWGQEDDRARAREAGFDRHLVKPVDPQAIEAILRAS